jgi:uncharacterized protein (DUF2164 family)
VKDFKLDKETKLELIKAVQTFFSFERDEEINEFQATIVLQFIIEKIGPYIYNHAVEDCCRFMTDRALDLYALQKRPATN